MPEITKRRVTHVRETAVAVAPGITRTERHVKVDYVTPDFLDAYVADAVNSGFWTSVDVSSEPDAGPGGYDGRTAIPDHLDHPEAGTVRPATTEV